MSPGRPALLTRWSLLLGLVAVGLTGCAEDYLLADDGAAAGDISNCRLDEDCADGQVCEEGLCSVDALPATTVALDLVPPPSSGALPQQWTAVAVSAGRRVPDIRLRSTVTLSGAIVSPGNPLAASIPARVIATLRDPIPGTSSQQSATAEDGSGFALTLVRDARYSLSVYPVNGALPPLIIPDLTVRHDTHQDIQLPRQEEYGEIRGRVVFEQGDSQGVANVRVQAFSEDLQRQSTKGISDASGQYSIVLPPGQATYTLRLEPTPENPYLPTVELPGLKVDRLLEQDVVLGGGGTEAVPVSGRLVDQAGRALSEGADLEFSAPIGRGTFTARVWVDLTGEFQLALLDGDYDIRVIPAPEGGAAVTLLHRAIPVGGGALEPLVVRSKSSFSGQIFDPLGAAPLHGVQVEALLVGEAELHGLYRVARQVSDAAGQFELQVDPGSFDLTFIPPVSSGMPRWVERGLRLASPAVRQFQARAPRVIRGLVRQPDDSGAAGVQVSVYDGNGPGSTLLGAGQTDADGHYRIVLPLEPGEAAAAEGATPLPTP